MATFNTVKTYALDGTTKKFDITFDYLARSHVQITIINDDGTRQILTLGTDYRFITATQIETTIAYGGVSTDPDSPTAISIELKRITPANKGVITFQDGSVLRSADLNLSNLQSIYIAEEGRELANEGLVANINGDLDARNRKIINLADGVADADAINKGQLDNAINGAQGIATAAAASASSAKASEVSAGNDASQAQIYAAQALASKNAAAASETTTLGYMNAAGSSVVESKQNADAAQNSAAESAQSATASKNSATDSATSSASATVQAGNAASSATAAAGSAVVAKNEADRAKAEADKVAGQNELTNAINSVGTSPGYKVDFKSMPSVGGVDIVQQLTTGGFQVNSDLLCKADGTGGNLNDAKFAGKNFMCEKPDTISGDFTSNKAPALMEYAQALVCDVYGIWTPSGLNEGKTRVQTMFDKNTTWVRGYHLEDDSWTPWKRVATQFFVNVSGMNANNLQDSGAYYYLKDTATVITSNVPHIDPPEDSDVYFLTVNSAKEGVDVMQTVHSPKTNSRFDRYLVDGTWSTWWNSTATFDVDTAPTGKDIDMTVNPGLWSFDIATMLNRPSFIPAGSTGKIIVEVLGLASKLCVQKVYLASPVMNISPLWMRTCYNPEVANQSTPTTPSWSGWVNFLQQDTSSKAYLKSLEMDSSFTPDNQYHVATKGYVDNAMKNAGGGSFLGQVQWFQNRTYLAPGYVPADGQLIEDDVYPEFAAALRAGTLAPSTTEALWNTPTNRGLYSAGMLVNGKQNFRMPDLNGASASSIWGPTLRGDAGGSKMGNDFRDGTVQWPAIDNVPGKFVSWSTTPSGSPSGAFQKGDSASAGYGAPNTAATSTWKVGVVNYDPSKVSTLYKAGIGEIRVASVVGCWAILVANAAPTSNGSINVPALATRVESINTSLKSQIDGNNRWVNWNDPMWATYFNWTHITTTGGNGQNTSPEMMLIKFDGQSFHFKGIFKNSAGWTANQKELFQVKALPSGFTKITVPYTFVLRDGGGAASAAAPQSYIEFMESVAVSAATPASIHFGGSMPAVGANPAQAACSYAMFDMVIRCE